MLITRTSPLSQEVNSLELDITRDQVVAYNEGAYIQVAFPNLSADDREFFKTGITAEEWNKVFGEEE